MQISLKQENSNYKEVEIIIRDINKDKEVLFLFNSNLLPPN
jgi:hypothetical protein